SLSIERRNANGSLDALPPLADDLVRLQPDVIVVSGGPAVRAARGATTSIPIVVSVGGDLLLQGYAASLARPGGNLTGQSIPQAGLSGKRLQLLKEAVPGISRVVVPWNTANPALRVIFVETQRAAETLGVGLISLDIMTPDLDAAFAAAATDGIDA